MYADGTNQLKVAYPITNLDIKKYNYDYEKNFIDKCYEGHIENVELPLEFKDYYDNKDWDKIIKFFLAFNCEIFAKVTKMTICDDKVIVDLKTQKFSKWYDEWKW